MSRYEQPAHGSYTDEWELPLNTNFDALENDVPYSGLAADRTSGDSGTEATEGAWYFATDTKEIYRHDGVDWALFATLSLSGDGTAAPNIVLVTDFEGADPSGATASDTAFDAAIADANPHDTILFYNGEYLLEGYRDITKPLTIKCVDATLTTNAVEADGSELPQIRFLGGGVEAQTGISSAVTEGARTIPVNDATIFSTNDRVLLMNESYTYGVNTPSQFAIVDDVDTGTNTITLGGATDQPFEASGDGGTVHRVDLLDGPRFVDVKTTGGGDIPLQFRWCENPVYDGCHVDRYKQLGLGAIDCFSPRWRDVVATDPVERGSGDGEPIAAYRCTDVYVESPRVYTCRRGVDLAWGCSNTVIIDPVVKGFSVAGISVHTDSYGGSVKVQGGHLVADPNGITGNGITGSPNGTTLSVENTTIVSRRAGIHASCPTTVSDVHISPAETTSSGTGLTIRSGDIYADGMIIDDPDGRFTQPIDIRTTSRSIARVDISAHITHPESDAVYGEAENGGDVLEDVTIRGCIDATGSATANQVVHFNASAGEVHNVTVAADIMGADQQGVRFTNSGTMGGMVVSDSQINSGLASVYSTGTGTFGTVRVSNCELLPDGSTAIDLSNAWDTAILDGNVLGGSVDTTGVGNVVRFDSGVFDHPDFDALTTDLSDHESDSTNPHNVTSNQTNSLSASGGTVSGNVTVTGDLEADTVTANTVMNVPVHDGSDPSEGNLWIRSDR